jgi:hypothetical protein
VREEGESDSSEIIASAADRRLRINHVAYCKRRLRIKLNLLQQLKHNKQKLERVQKQATPSV